MAETCSFFLGLKPTRPGKARAPMADTVQHLLAQHHAWDIFHNMALVVIGQTYDAVLGILGPDAPLSGGGGHVQVSQPVDPADPDSPVLCVNASDAHCCIRLVTTSCCTGGGGGAAAAAAPGCKKYTSPEWGTSVSVAPGTLHLTRTVDGGGGRCRVDGWRCAEVRPDVAAKGPLGVLETVRSRLDTAIRVESRMIEMARAVGCGGPKVREIVEARAAMERMREEVDLDAIVRRRCQKRRRVVVVEIGGQPDRDQADDDAEALADRLGAVHVSQKRRRRRAPATKMDACHRGDAELLASGLMALHV
ncbi:hypothetical protein ACP4OV_002880 [Aristida adscensionis]